MKETREITKTEQVRPRTMSVEEMRWTSRGSSSSLSNSMLRIIRMWEFSEKNKSSELKTETVKHARAITIK